MQHELDSFDVADKEWTMEDIEKLRIEQEDAIDEYINM